MLKIVNSFSLFSKFVFKICFRLIIVTKRVFLVFEKFEYRKQKIFYLLKGPKKGIMLKIFLGN